MLGILKDIRALIPDDSGSYAARIARDTIDIMIVQTEEIIGILDDVHWAIVFSLRWLQDSADGRHNVSTNISKRAL